MAIAHVNTGAKSTTYSGTSTTLALPASIVAGNLLLGFITTRGSVGTITWPDGWTVVDSQETASSTGNTSVAYRLADGSESDPVLSHASSSTLGVICQFSGADGVGNAQKNTSASVGENVGAFTSTGDASVSAYLWSVFTPAGELHMPTPSGWSRIVAESSGTPYNVTNSLDVGIKTLGAIGSSSGAISENSGSGYWSLFNIEITAATVAEGTSAVTLGSIAGSATASSGNSSVVTLGEISGSANAITGAGGSSIVTLSAIAGSASAISQAIANEDHAVVVDGSAIGEVLRLAFADSAVLASSSASSPLVLLVTVDSAVLAAHAATAFREMSVVVDSGVALSSSAPVAAVYLVAASSLCSVLTGLQFVADFTDGWSYNLNTGAGSFYEGFRFNSFALIDGEYYGANETGLFRMGGDTDDSLPINLTVTLGTSNLGSSKVKRVPSAYVGAQSDQPLVLTCRVEGQEYSYTFSRATAALSPAKVQIGKGLAGVYWQIELKNTDGANAEIDSLELLVAESAQRRVP